MSRLTCLKEASCWKLVGILNGLGGWGQGGEEGIGGLYLKKTKLESRTKFCAASNVLDRGTGMREGRI